MGRDGKVSFVNLTPHLVSQVRHRGGVQNLNLGFFRTPDIDMSQVAVDKEVWDRLLHGEAMVASFKVKPGDEDVGSQLKVTWEEDASPFLDYFLTDTLGQVVGRLKVPSSTREPALEGDSTCECVAISEGKAYDSRSEWLKKIYIKEWSVIEEARDLDEFEFYNIVWVERRDEIAYRMGLRSVWKEGWHRQNPETRDIVLG